MTEQINNSDTMTIGERIKHVRSTKNISQTELAELSGLTAQYISLLETNRKNPSLKSIILICNSLGVSADLLLHGITNEDIDSFNQLFKHLLSDCTQSEKRIIFETAIAVKNSLRANIRIEE